jgi:hypothetical protein
LTNSLKGIAMNALIENFGQQRAAELRASGSRHRLAARLRPRIRSSRR